MPHVTSSTHSVRHEQLCTRPHIDARHIDLRHTLWTRNSKRDGAGILGRVKGFGFDIRPLSYCGLTPAASTHSYTRARAHMNARTCGILRRAAQVCLLALCWARDVLLALCWARDVLLDVGWARDWLGQDWLLAVGLSDDWAVG